MPRGHGLRRSEAGTSNRPLAVVHRPQWTRCPCPCPATGAAHSPSRTTSDPCRPVESEVVVLRVGELWPLNPRVRGSSPGGAPVELAVHRLVLSSVGRGRCGYVMWVRRRLLLLRRRDAFGRTGSGLGKPSEAANFDGGPLVGRLPGLGPRAAAARTSRAVASAVVVFVGEDAGVGVGGQHDAGVPQLLLDDLQIGAGGVREAGRAVPQLVQPNRRQPGLFGRAVEPAGQIVRVQRLPVGCGEHVPGVLPHLPSGDSLLLLTAPVTAAP
jgi:hypothetical protein